MIDTLHNTADSGTHRKHMSMIKEVLVIDPKQRPKASLIAHEIFLRAQKTLYSQTLKLFGILCALSTAFELVLERERFFLWGWGTQLIDDRSIISRPSDQPLRRWLVESRQSAESVDRLLNLMSSEVQSLEEILKPEKDHTRTVFARSRTLNDELLVLLPQTLRATVQSQLESRLVKREDLPLFVNTQSMTSMSSLGRNIALLASVRYMTVRVEKDRKGPSKRLLLKEEEIPETKEVHMHRLGTIMGANNVKRNILLEYTSYDPEWVDQRHMSDLYTRADALAELLSRDQMPENFRILKCSGYYLEIAHSSIGLVYDFPAGLAPSTMPISLKTLIQRFRKPEVGTLFRLAYSIVQCVAQFHHTQWLHKNINCHNNLFFDDDLSALVHSLRFDKPGKDEWTKEESRKDTSRSQTPQSSVTSVQKKAEGLGKPSKRRHFPLFRGRSREKSSTRSSKKGESSSTQPPPEPTNLDIPLDDGRRMEPSKWDDRPAIVAESSLDRYYLVGFNHSRQDEDTAFTTGPRQKGKQKLYQHPEY